MATRSAALVCASLAVLPGAGYAEAPLSAIGWLSDTVTAPAAPVAPEEVASSSGATSAVTVTVLGAPSPDAAGVLPSSVTGLPRRLWGLGRTDEIGALIAVDRGDALPALTGLVLTVLLAEADPPADSDGRGRLLLARVDRLLEKGAIEQAQALLAAAGGSDPELFRRTFDVALLIGDEDGACATMVATPALAPTFPARIFCLARSGDWNAAALTLRTGVALGHITTEEEALLSRFLDPDLYEGEGSVLPPKPVTPLAWRMLEAIGEALPTANLPLAFSHAELRETSGWKAQIEAAERLTRAGVLQPNLLLGFYTRGDPAASGGVWDRVDAFQQFEAALAAGDAVRVAQALPAAWARMVEAELEVPFAEMFARPMARLAGKGGADAATFRVVLLSSDYEKAAALYPAVTAAEAFAAGVAAGDVTGLIPPDSLARAIAEAFAAPDPGPDMLSLLDGQRLGEAILVAVDRVREGVKGDLRGVTEGLSLLRRVGLEDVARRTALELLLLERRG